MTTLIVVAVLATLIAFLLTAADTALTHVSRHRARQLAEEGKRGAAQTVAILNDSAPYLAVASFVRVAAEATAVVLVAVAVDMQTGSHWQTAVITIAIMSVVSFVIVGVSPRTLGRQHSERYALLAAPTVRVLRMVFGPLAKLLIWLGNALTPGSGYTDGPFASESELRSMVDLAGESDVIEDNEREMIHSIFELGDTVAREVMVPRPDIVWIHRDKVLRQAMSLFLRSGHSRIPVVGESTDDIQGLLYFKDTVRYLNSHPDAGNDVRIAEIMSPVQRVPESKPVDSLLREMQRDRLHFAIVIDEYGGTSGLITIEDVLEEIVGEIADEHDREVNEDAEELPDTPGTWRVPASMPVDDLAELFEVEIETEDVDTVGGLLASVVGQVPIVGSCGEVAGLELTAERIAGRRRRVASVLARKLDPAPVDGSDGSGDEDSDVAETVDDRDTDQVSLSDQDAGGNPETGLHEDGARPALSGSAPSGHARHDHDATQER